MELSVDVKKCYNNCHTIELQGSLNDAHWFVWDHTYEDVTLCHDTDESIIKALKAVGDKIDVWIDDDKTVCKLEVKSISWSYDDSEKAFITLPIYAIELAEDMGNYDFDTNMELTD